MGVQASAPAKPEPPRPPAPFPETPSLKEIESGMEYIRNNPNKAMQYILNEGDEWRDLKSLETKIRVEVPKLHLAEKEGKVKQYLEFRPCELRNIYSGPSWREKEYIVVNGVEQEIDSKKFPLERPPDFSFTKNKLCIRIKEPNGKWVYYLFGFVYTYELVGTRQDWIYGTVYQAEQCWNIVRDGKLVCIHERLIEDAGHGWCYTATTN